ncbi:MAG: C-terminal binding protein [Candidatus Omnitrophica bacterium]|nr:C-terminal binding protein [Candidatus Omnitrophota bacterium]
MTKHPFILIPDLLKAPARLEQGIFGKKARIMTPCAHRPEEISDKVWKSADAILVWHWMPMRADVIEKLDRCRVIVRMGVGVDSVDLAAAGKRGIRVCNVPDYGTEDVADHALALFLTLARGIYAFSENVRASNSHWNWHSAGTLHRITGSVLGIIGLGPIGTAVAMRAKAFGMQVLFYDPYIGPGQEKALGIKRCRSLDELLSAADAVSMHVPLTPETKGMADASFFFKMKKDALFINTSRGALMDLDALHAALKSGCLRGAGLDVLPIEPADNKHPLIKAWRKREAWIAHRLVITPHAAFVSVEADAELRSKAALEAKRVLEGKKPFHCVNEKWLKTA